MNYEGTSLRWKSHICILLLYLFYDMHTMGALLPLLINFFDRLYFVLCTNSKRQDNAGLLFLGYLSMVESRH